MTQDERWRERFNEVKSFIETNHRNPSRYDADERGKYCNLLRHNKKLFNSGELKEERKRMFQKLMELSEENKHKNQYK